MRSAPLHILPVLLFALYGCGDTSSEGSVDGNDGPSAAKRPERPIEVQDRLERARELSLLLQFDRAEKELEAALKVSPDDPELLFQLSKMAQYGKGDLDTAASLLQRAFAKDPGSYKIAQALRRILTRQANHEESMFVLRALVEHNPENLDLHLEYARGLSQWIYRLPGDPTTKSLLEARAYHLERVLDQQPTHVVAMDTLAQTYLRMGDFETALKRYDILSRVLAARPHPKVQLYKVFSQIAACHFKLGRFAPASEFYRRSIQLANRNPSAMVDNLTGEARWSLRLSQQRAGQTAQPPLPLRFRIPSVNPSELGGLSFTEAARDLGIDKYDGAGPSAWADANGDGRIDLFVSGCNTFSALYLGREDGTFQDWTREAGLADLESSFGSILADFDNDSDKDLFLVRDGWFGTKANSLYENDGSGRFKDVTERAGLGDEGSGFTATVFDYDQDGLLDILVANGVAGDGSNNRLYRNMSGLRFEDVTEQAGLLEPDRPRTIGIGVFDFDRDGDLDIFAAGYISPNRLFRNEGDGTFQEIGAQAMVRGSEQELGYVVFLADFDNDTWPDIVSSQYEHRFAKVLGDIENPGGDLDAIRTRAFRNKGNGTFEEVYPQIAPAGTMGGNYGDFDNDGFLDIYLGCGGPEIGRFEPNTLWRNRGDMTFVNASFETRTDHIGKGHGVTVADADNDGDLDIYSPQGGAFHGDSWANVYYRNETRNGNHWLKLRLQGTESSRDAIGTQVTLTLGTDKRYSCLQNGVGFGSTNSLELHFGLGSNDIVDRLEIQWPSGKTNVLEKVSADQALEIVEGP